MVVCVTSCLLNFMYTCRLMYLNLPCEVVYAEMLLAIFLDFAISVPYSEGTFFRRVESNISVVKPHKVFIKKLVSRLSERVEFIVNYVNVSLCEVVVRLTFIYTSVVTHISTCYKHNDNVILFIKSYKCTSPCDCCKWCDQWCLRWCDREEGTGGWSPCQMTSPTFPLP